MASISRRRIIAISAAVAGLWAGRAARAVEPVEWRGVALGAPARLVLHHPDRPAALRLLERMRGEIERLERIFSLYRPDSALVMLNGAGRLDSPPADLVVCLNQALSMAALSGGAFDPTVQPLWDLHARHFAQPHPDPAGPAPADIEAARALVDWRRVRLAADVITLAPGMAVTLNGIAQGYATDRVADLLRAHGLATVLVHLGETRIAGRPEPRGAWRIALPDGRIIALAEDTALATSSPDGTRFSPCCHHLFDPTTGRSARDAVPVTLRAPTAALADALSTAAAIAPQRAAEMIGAVPGAYMLV